MNESALAGVTDFTSLAGWRSMYTENQLRQHLAEALRNACQAGSDEEKEGWLLLAQGWLNLLRKQKQIDEEVFSSKRAGDSKPEE